MPPLFPLLPKAVPPYHHLFASLEKWCLSFEGKKRSFKRIFKDYLCGASSLWFRTTWSSRSSLLVSYLHLTHEILNHTYPPMPLNTGSPPMGKRRKNCVSYPNSVKIIHESLRQGAIGRNSQHQGMKVVVSPIISNKKCIFFPIYVV